MSHTYFRVNPHSIVAWMSRNCYWSLCPRGYWDPGFVSNWFVSSNNIATIWTVINICTKMYNVDKNYKDLVWHILLTVHRWRSASHNTEMQAWDAIPHIYHIWGMVTKYCQYEVLNFADKLHMQYNPFKTLFVSDTAEYIQKIWMMRNQNIRHRKIDKMCGTKNRVSQKLTT